MKKVFSRYFVCEDGHTTVGDAAKTKCGAEKWQKNYVKGKRKGQWVEELAKDKPCDKKIVEEGIIPDELDYFSIWDYKIMHAFLVGQKFDAEFIIGLQKAFVSLRKLIGDKNAENAGRDGAGAAPSKDAS